MFHKSSLVAVCSAVLFLNLALLVNSEDSTTPARLLVEKQVLNKYLVESKDILIHYNIFNVGGR